MSGRVTRSRKNAANETNGNIISTTAELAVEKTSKRRPRKKSEAEENGNTKVTNDKGTPPKTGRYNRDVDSNYSPSSLINRLSINIVNDHSEEDTENEVKPIVAPRKKIEKARKLLHNAETEQLYGREKELEELETLLQTNMTGGTSASLYVSGQPGKIHQYRTLSNCCEWK